MTENVWTPTPRAEIDRPSFPGWQSQEYVPLAIIEVYAEDTLLQLAKRCGGEITFPLDAERLVREVFGLEVYYDDGEIMSELGDGLLGCLYADGMPCPATGSDRVIMINDSPRFRGVTTAFTILHEGGHWLLHHPKDARQATAAAYCRKDDVQPRWSRVPPREWQASRFAGEVLMPKERVAWLLDGQEPGSVVNLEIYGSHIRAYFGVSQAAMEKRLHDLDYRCAFGRYAYANVTDVSLVKVDVEE